jgi:phenylacetic acid degradation protein
MPSYEFAGKRPSVDRHAFVHPLAVLIGDVEIAAFVYVGAGAVLRGDIGPIQVGKGSNVQENSIVHSFPGKSTIIHSDVVIGHGCILHGCEICSTVLIGMGTIIADGVKINSNCLVAAGSFLPLGLEIPSGSVVMGSPAKVVKSITQERLEDITSGLELYQGLTKQYLSSFSEIAP